MYVYLSYHIPKQIKYFTTIPDRYEITAILEYRMFSDRQRQSSHKIEFMFICPCLIHHRILRQNNARFLYECTK